MPADAQDSFLEFHIEKLLAGASVPVDLAEVGRRIGAVVHEREMIPEAVMQVRGEQFHIFLQSNFKDRPGANVRQRFSFAHELAHALFYEQRDGELKPRKDAPSGDRLEQTCNRAAGMLLVPTRILKQHSSERGRIDPITIVTLASDFGVSMEVMLRRLHDIRAFDSGETAPVLTRRVGKGLVIEFAVYMPWLKSHLPTPKRGGDFMAWFRPEDKSAANPTRTVSGGVLAAQPFDLTGSLRLYEVSFQQSD